MTSGPVYGAAADALPSSGYIAEDHNFGLEGFVARKHPSMHQEVREIEKRRDKRKRKQERRDRRERTREEWENRKEIAKNK